MVLANPITPERQLDLALHDSTLAAGLDMLAAEGVTGKDVTPRLLEYFHRDAGASLRVNVDLVLSNASLAGDVAVALSVLSERGCRWGPSRPGGAGPPDRPGRRIGRVRRICRTARDLRHPAGASGIRGR